MKKILILITLSSLFLMGVSSSPGLMTASPKSIKLVRLTIVNKSGLPLEIKLSGENVENFYYLRVPAGDRTLPTEEVFTIARDTYQVQPYYIELWDPVYGSSCGGAGSRTYYAFHNIKITFLECYSNPRNRGESPIYKWPGLRYLY